MQDGLSIHNCLSMQIKCQAALVLGIAERAGQKSVVHNYYYSAHAQKCDVRMTTDSLLWVFKSISQCDTRVHKWTHGSLYLCDLVWHHDNVIVVAQ